MKQPFKYVLLASAAAIVLGIATPSQAQQDNARMHAATSQRIQQPDQTWRYAAPRAEQAGEEAYGYVPMQPRDGSDSCVTEGTYGKGGVDYGNCY